MNSASDSTRKPLDASMRGVLIVALPLIVSAGSFALKIFIDRLMLARYSRTDMNASMPATLTVLVFQTTFQGTVQYAQVFVAQYLGAKRADRAGIAVWQALIFALAGGLTLAAFGHSGAWLFAQIGHDPIVQRKETDCFTILMAGSVFTLSAHALATFWNGLGRTKVVMLVTSLSVALNVLLNWLLIFGNAGWPRMGIAGAALATAASELFSFAVYFCMFLQRDNRVRFGTWPARVFDGKLMRRLLSFGLPNGLHFFVDIAAFNVLILIMGLLPHGAGGDPQEASNIAFGINALAFLPMVGISQAAGILVGQAVGAGEIPAARRVVKHARNLVLLGMGSMALVFVLWPEPLLACFSRANDADQAGTLQMARTLLRYVAAWMLLDGLWLVCLHALRGAGDTRWAMIVGMFLGWFGLALPGWIAFKLGASVWTLWAILVAYVWIGALIYYLRYRSGKWEKMRVIEAQLPEPLTTGPDVLP